MAEDGSSYAGRLRKRRRPTDGCAGAQAFAPACAARHAQHSASTAARLRRNEEVVKSLLDLVESCERVVIFSGSGLSANSGGSGCCGQRGPAPACNRHHLPGSV